MSGSGACRFAFSLLACLALVSHTFAAPSRASRTGCATPEVTAVRNLMRDEGKYAEAEAKGREMLQKAETGPGPTSLDAACALDLIAEVMEDRRELKSGEALAMAERALRIKEAVFGPVHAETAATRNIIAGVLYDGGHLQAAREEYERVLQIRRQVFGDEAIEVAWAQDNLAICLTKLAEYEDARNHLQASIKISEKLLPPDSPYIAAAHFNLASLFRETSHYEEALENYRKALEIIQRPGSSQKYRMALILNAIALTLDQIGERPEALRYFDKTLALARDRAEEDPSFVATVLNNLGRCHAHLHEFEKAKLEYDEALKIFLAHADKDSTSVAMVLQNRGDVFEMVGDRAPARADYERALAIREKLLGPDDVTVATMLRALGALENEQADYRAAIRLYERALKITRAKLDPRDPDIAEGLSGEALAYASMGETQRAEHLLVESRRIRELSLGPGHPETAAAMVDLAALQFESGAEFQAMKLALQAETSSVKHVRLVSGALAQRVALGYALSRPSGLDTLLSIVALHPDGRDVAKIWGEVIRSRAIVLDEMAGRQRSAAGAADPKVAAASKALAAAQQRLAHLILGGGDSDHPDAFEKLVREASDEADLRERELAEVSAPFMRRLVTQSAGVRDVAYALPADTALVAYIRYQSLPFHGTSSRTGASRTKSRLPEASYLAFVLSGPSTSPRAVPLGSAVEIEDLVQRWYEAVSREPKENDASDSEGAYRKVAAKLRKRIWDPVAARLGGAKRVLVVPDGSLDLVDFDTLPTSPSRYLIDTGPLIHYLSTERDLVELKQPAPQGSGILALGGADFDASSLFAELKERPAGEAIPHGIRLAKLAEPAGPEAERNGCVAYRSARFASLPASAGEAETVSGIWRSAHETTGSAPSASAPELLLTGAQASEAAFKKDAPGRSILHIATHGFFLGGKCHAQDLSARGVTMIGPARSTASRPFSNINPLLLSGLALAGANHRDAAGASEEDGMLTALEVASMDLSGVQWAVLAGCDTGTGRVEAGEGVLGLRRAFQIAGARTIVMSLWAMKDSNVRTWMTYLYQHRFTDHLDTAESVRQASLDVLEDKRASGESTHPYSWGGWIASGDWK